MENSKENMHFFYQLKVITSNTSLIPDREAPPLLGRMKLTDFENSNVVLEFNLRS